MTWFRTIYTDGIPTAYERFDERPPTSLNSRRSKCAAERIFEIPDVEGTYQQYLVVRNDYIIRSVLKMKESLREWLKCCNTDPEDLTARQ